MAGEIQIPERLTKPFYDELKAAGLTLQVQVDCSHNTHVQTRRQDRPHNPIIAKPIELDASFQAITNPAQLAAVNGRLQGARSTSALFRLYQAMTRLPGGVNALSQRNLKVEFPNFDEAFINLTHITIRDAVTACRAANAAAFNVLQPHVRQAMGMYLWQENTGTFQQTGAREPQPRTAIG